jgi:hypothetical protein
MAGAICILIAYVGHQLKWMAARSVVYNVLNTVGAAILLYIALKPFQVGFVILEFVWTVISIAALVRVLRGTAVMEHEG